MNELNDTIIQLLPTIQSMYAHIISNNNNSRVKETKRAKKNGLYAWHKRGQQKKRKMIISGGFMIYSIVLSNLFSKNAD